jgi:hypothetical protein
VTATVGLPDGTIDSYWARTSRKPIDPAQLGCGITGGGVDDCRLWNLRSRRFVCRRNRFSRRSPALAAPRPASPERTSQRRANAAPPTPLVAKSTRQLIELLAVHGFPLTIASR